MKSDPEKQIKELKDKIADLESRIREMKEIESETRASQENFRDIIETFKYGIIYTTLTGEVITINKNLEKIVGINAEELVGHNIITLAQKYFATGVFNRILPGLKTLVTGRNIPPFQVEYQNIILEVIPNINLKSRRLTAILVDITEKERIQSELKISKERLSRAELAGRSGNWELQLDSGIMHGSEGALKLYGVRDFQLDYELVRNVPVPEYRKMLDMTLEQLIKTGKPYNIEFKIRNAETGEILDIHSIAEFDREKRIVFGVIQDITERKIAEEEIKRKNLELARFLDITLELMETVDKATVLKRILEGAISLIGLDSGAIYLIDGEKLYLEVTTPPLPAAFPEELRRASLSDHPRIKDAVENKRTVVEDDIAGAEQTAAERIVVESRNLRSMIYVPLIVQKKAAGILIIGSSGKKHVFTEHEIDLSRTMSNIASLTLENTFLFNNLTIARDKAQESDRLKTAFLHNISHEIRTPLNAIIGFSGFLDQPDLTETERKEYVDIIFQSNNQLLSIINDILNISQIETGQITFRESAFDLGVAIRNLFRQFLPEVKRKGLELKLNAPSEFENREIRILADEAKLNQVITSLISNAIKFTNEGSITIAYYLHDGKWNISVTDTGIGIPAEEQEKVFDRFYQVNVNGTRTFGGTGLGLSISRAFAILMGGSLNLSSIPGKGTTVTLIIPQKFSDEGHSRKIAAASVTAGEKHPDRTILVVEDEDSNFSLINTILKPLNFNIIRAVNGKEAIDFCYGAEIDLVLMDIKMPVLDGLIATTEILKFKPDLKIIAQSAYAQASEKEKALDSGCIDYITKPFSKDTLLTVVRKYITQA